MDKGRHRFSYIKKKTNLIIYLVPMQVSIHVLYFNKYLLIKYYIKHKEDN